ncbi:diguanylate cyclase [Sulfurifustis variabilis]|uniref:cyclic-guanylate-specific phosphodiesterase n=1 Tax=Sulfurifustis variabilis TaxID=1675686 RepID=A0A1B4V271_9GAMM|nr:EAL domain-containing protein [Sulfurifustis variabilis]BAU47618.1 diguanylate cyclase [Sulfurifustis variabilis]
MVRLSRAYSFASFVGIAIVAIALSWFYRNLAVEALVQYQTLSNVELTRTVANTLWPRYADFIANAGRIPVEHLATQPEIARLASELEQKLYEVNVTKVKIYNMYGLTVFSTDARQIGENKQDNPGFRKARNGETASDLVFRDHYSPSEDEVERRNLLSSYVPIRPTDDGPVEGVFEVYVDVTALLDDIARTERTVLAGVVGVLLVLYLFLYAIVRRADRLLEQHEDEERKAQQERIRHLAYHDALTGLPNRALFKDRLQHAVDLAQREGAMIGVMFIDLDRFKVINDSLGHERGDRVLVEAAARIRGAMRTSDTACRIGGDEFVVILERLASADEAARVAGRLLEEFARPMDVGARELVVSPSIGIAVYPGPTREVDRLLKDADAAMHGAKEMGRNRYLFYTEELNARVQETLEYELGLRQALARDEFTLHYQPRVDVQSGRVVSVEALLRWRHPARGIVLPDHFIRLLEDTGMITPVGEWVVRQACRQCREWHLAGHDGVRVAVNISLLQFRSNSLVYAVRRALTEAGLAPQFLELELTETVLADDMGQVLAQLRELRGAGVQISIDDFGTGYSALSYLTQFPVDYLKIDRSFIQGVGLREDHAAITRAIAAMARSLHLGVIGEGVETSEQMRFLQGIGCNVMQGDLFSPPVAAEHSADMLAIDMLAAADTRTPRGRRRRAEA